MERIFRNGVWLGCLRVSGRAWRSLALCGRGGDDVDEVGRRMVKGTEGETRGVGAWERGQGQWKQLVEGDSMWRDAAIMTDA